MVTLDALLYTRGASHVTRYHSVPTLHRTSIAEHTFNVLNLVLFLTKGEAGPDLIKAALHHDIAEITTGDIPAPVKRNSAIKYHLNEIELEVHHEYDFLHPENDLEEHDRQILKLADCYEGLFYTMEEYDMGNRLIQLVLMRWVAYIGELNFPDEIAGQVLSLARHIKEWLEARSIILGE